MAEQQANTWVKVPALPPQQADGPLLEIYEATSSNPHGREAADGLHANESNILTPKSIMTVGCWNVRTLYTTGATALLIHELKKLRWDIIGIAETHWTGVEDKRYEDYRILSCGREDMHRSGVALVLSPLAEKALQGHNPVNDRIITARFRTTIGRLTVCQVYAPTTTASDNDMDEFYSTLQETISRIPKKDLIILMGDFNAKVGSQFQDTNGVVGKFGYGQRNARGDRLVEFCGLNELIITNTQFKQSKDNRYWTWLAPNGIGRNQIDYIMISKKWRGSVRNSRSFPSADIGSDHQMVLANLKLKLKRNFKKKKRSRADTLKLKDEHTKEKYHEEIEVRWNDLLSSTRIEDSPTPGIDEEWEHISTIMRETADKTIGRMTGGKRPDWISLHTLELSDERREWKERRRESKEMAKHYNYLCRQVKKSAKTDKERYINELCKSIEESRKQNKSREVYEGIRKLTGKSANQTSIVKDKDGSMITDADKVKTRWKQYFEELYNDPNPVDERILVELENNRDEEPTPSIMIEEVTRAIERLKTGKAPGIDNITAEEIKAATEGNGMQVIFKLCKRIWDEEVFPKEWKRAIIVPVYKKKDKLDCNNYRGISLLCHSSKIMTTIIMERIKKRTEEILSEEQAGFRTSRSTIDQIFTLRQLAEKYSDFSKDLFVCYVDFKKAFDSVWREGLWKVMRRLGYPEKIVRILESLYRGTFSAVRVGADVSEWFETIVGVLQGCMLSPILFNIFLEVIMAQSLDKINTGAVMNGRIINNLRFADDIAVLAEKEVDLQGMVNRIATESTRMGMKINTGKTEVQHIGLPKCNAAITIDKDDLKQVEEFVYLGGNMSEDATTTQDLKRRVGLACGAMQKLCPIWKAKDIRVSTKLRVYEALVLSILMYNSETWTLREEDKNRLRVFEMNCLRKIKGVTRRDRIRNTDIRSEMGMEVDVVQKIQKRRLRYYGHVVRMKPERLPNVALFGHVHGKRKRGRPRKRWFNNLEQDAEEMGMTMVEACRLAASDRNAWRDAVGRLSERGHRSSP
jgi:hypothetical protein